MTSQNMEKITLLLKRFYIPWIVLYAVLILGTVAFGASLYKTHDENQLPPGHIELKVNKTRYQLGEVVAFTVINHFPTTVYVTNECPEEPLNVYRWENEQWVQIHDIAEGEDSECYTEPRNVPIPSEGSRSYTFTEWPNLFTRPGVYRIATAIDHYGDVPFQDFVILEPAEVIEVTQPTIPATSAVTPPAEIFQEEIYEEEESEHENEEKHEREEEHESEDD